MINNENSEKKNKHNLKKKDIIPSIIQKHKQKSPIILSENQESLWIINKLNPSSSSYLLSYSYILQGMLNKEVFIKSLEKMIDRHGSLRTYFDLKDNEPRQFVIDKIEAEKFFQYYECTTEKEVHEIFQKEKEKPIDLSQWPLFKVHLVKVKNKYYLLFIVHHIIFDPYSFFIFFKELSELYRSLLNNEKPNLVNLPIEYGDFAIWQKEEDDTKKIKEQLLYWKNILQDSSELLELPIDNLRPAVFTGKGAKFHFKFSAKLVQNLKILAKKLNITYYALTLSAFFVLLYRYTGQTDLIIGTTNNNRKQKELENVIGLFLQMLILRQKVDDKISFSDFSKEVMKTINEASANSDCSFESIVDAVNPQRNPSFNPIFQIAFGIEESLESSLNLEKVKSESFYLKNKATTFDLYLKLTENEDASIEYYSEIYNEETIRRLIDHFKILLENIVLNSDVSIDLVPIMSKDEIEKICFEWNKNQTNYPRDSSIVEVFEEIVEKYPQNIALRFDTIKMTYKNLNEEANKLANYLKSSGVKKNEFVGISLDKSINLIIGILAILKAGGVYLPIDANYPTERKHFIVNDTKIKFLIIQEDFIDQYPDFNLKFVCFEKIQKELEKHSNNNLKIKVDPLDGAYVNYTSGSTGKPKGVEVTNRGVLHLVKNTNWIDFLFDDRFLFVANISFDVSAFEVWSALLNGATLCIYPYKKLDLEEMASFLTIEEITQVVFSAKFFNLMVDEKIESLKKLRFLQSCGDVMSMHHAIKAFKTLNNCSIINGYGPTENTTFSTSYTINNLKNIKNSVPIGKPVSNTSIYILDKYLNPVPIGVIGEIYTGGDGVARGYINREDLTKERFIKDPFSKEANAKMYKTGDLARYLPDGNILFIGRIDNQIKLRGFRIELGEIEEIVKKVKGVIDCLCLITQEGTGEKQLVAYVEGKNIDSIEIRKYLESKLPQHMMPDYIILLEKFPLSPTGKINRKALPSPREVLSEEKKEYEAPNSSIEQLIADVWATLLKIPKVSRKDNFFYIGGHSINAAQLATILSKSLGKTIPVTLIFEDPILEKYSSKIEEILSEQKGKEKKEILYKDLFWSWRNKEIKLDPIIGSEKLAEPKDVQYSNPMNIFITGATGFIGCFLLHTLLEKTQANIYCHIRAISEKKGFEQLVSSMKKYEIWDEKFSKRIIIVIGDLEKKLLGIKSDIFEDLTKSIDSIFHIGALVNHVFPYEKLKAANILGTEEVIRLAMTKKLKPLHFTSTTDVFEPKDELKEDEDLNKMKNLFNGYAQTKWVDEKIIDLARTKGLKANIFRLHRICGSSKNGSGPTTDFLWRMVQASIHLNVFPKVNLEENLTPVNFIVEAMWLISTKKDFINKQYNLFNPKAIHYSDIFKILQELGYKMKMMNYDEWRHLLIKESLKEGEEKLLALVPLFEMLDLTKENQHVNYRNDNVKEALKDSLKIPEIDKKLIKLYVDYYVKIGYLPPYA